MLLVVWFGWLCIITPKYSMTKDQIGKVKKNQVVTKCCCLFNFFLLISLWFTTDKMNKLLEIQACSISFLTNRLFSLTRIELNDPLKSGGATLWARIAQNVKKPSLTENVIDFEFFGFNVSIWVPWSPLGPKKS